MIFRLIIFGFPFMVYPMQDQEVYYATMEKTAQRQYLDTYFDIHSYKHKQIVKKRYEDGRKKRENRQNIVRPVE